MTLIENWGSLWCRQQFVISSNAYLRKNSRLLQVFFFRTKYEQKNVFFSYSTLTRFPSFDITNSSAISQMRKPNGSLLIKEIDQIWSRSFRTWKGPSTGTYVMVMKWWYRWNNPSWISNRGDLDCFETSTIRRLKFFKFFFFSFLYWNYYRGVFFFCSGSHWIHTYKGIWMNSKYLTKNFSKLESSVQSVIIQFKNWCIMSLGLEI